MKKYLILLFLMFMITSVSAITVISNSGNSTFTSGINAGSNNIWANGFYGALDWSDLTSVPSGLADGDDDTTYSAGSNLTLGGTTFSVDTSSLKTWFDLFYQPIGSYLTSESDPYWTANYSLYNTSWSTDTDTQLSEVTVDSYADNNNYLDFDSFTNTCPAGNFVQNITSGTVQCDAPSGSGDVTGVYTNGQYLTGGSASGEIFIVLNETVLNATIDSRSGGSETDPLWSANYTLYNTSWSTDTDTTYSALSEFSDDLGNRGYTHLSNFTDDSTHTVDTNAGTICSGTNALLGNGSCYQFPLVDTDTDTTYSAGSNLTLTTTTFSLDTTSVRSWLDNIYQAAGTYLTSWVLTTNLDGNGFNISVDAGDKLCVNAGCTRYIYDNGTGIIIQG